MATKALVTIGSNAKVITHTGFKNYDVCMNTYVGCEFGCTYCYVRFFVKDEHKDWGEFVRVREHIKDKLPKELSKGYVSLPDGRTQVFDEHGKPTGKTKPKSKSLAIPEARLVIGTMTDPYQPSEKKYRITRSTLQILLNNSVKFKKVGIFTRSPLVLQDLDLIKQLPKARVHFTITPYPQEIMRQIEPYSPKTTARWNVIKKLKEAGIRVHVNVAPVMPVISEGSMIEDWIKQLTELKVDEYFVDPMQAYQESFAAFKKVCENDPKIDWRKIEDTMLDKQKYLDWKADYFETWNNIRKKYQHKAPDQLPIWSDHESHVWVNMNTLTQMDYKYYNDDL